MRGITISDEKGNLLCFDLIDILKIIGEKAILSTWEISNVESVGNSAEDLHKISDESIPISGKELFLLSSHITQIIDGTFKAYLENQEIPWLLIRAVDSSEYDVECDDENVLTKIRQSFSKISDLPNC